MYSRRSRRRFFIKYKYVYEPNEGVYKQQEQKSGLKNPYNFLRVYRSVFIKNKSISLLKCLTKLTCRLLKVYKEICMGIFVYLMSENPQIPYFKVWGQICFFFFWKIDAQTPTNTSYAFCYCGICVLYV